MVFLITQNEPFGGQMTQQFTQKGFPCSLSGNGQQALDQIRTAHPIVVILDLYVHNPTGIEVLRLLRSKGTEERSSGWPEGQ